ncbi:Acyl-CoA:1-acyl-sn-glycerol-3-phosphate acyltransferase [hydrothermal vent metagenome]|uniref:Acyl-CoA:1-acyl-sn-glycerol-3-phosphate acyltransferase n=1 Tax=hydrothermal vent metagenome TaxID=652676 RepID=A0A3B1A0B4_9ZZZZ
MDNLIALLRSLLFSVIYVVSAILFSIPSVLTYPLPFEQRYRFIKQWARFNVWSLKICCNLSFEIKGQENIPTEPVICLVKHQSTWETLALQLVFPAQVWLLKRELLWLPFFGWGLAMLEPIAIDRKAGRQAVKQLINQGTERLQKGRWVVIYPEGTRVKIGEHKPYKLGGAILAEHSKYPVLPVAHNAGHFWSKQSFIKKPGVITLSIGPIIDSKDKKAAEINQLVESWIETECAQLEHYHSG